MRVGVYAGARPGNDRAYIDDAALLGRLLGSKGIDVVYGGGANGLMGALAQAALAAGGRVIGVSTAHIAAIEGSRRLQLSELIMVDSITSRRQRIFELVNALVALPGGLGTLEETLEVWSWRHIRVHDKPLFFLNTRQFWRPLLCWVDELVEAGFVRSGRDLRPIVCDDAHSVVSALLAEEEKSAIGAGPLEL